MAKDQKKPSLDLSRISVIAEFQRYAIPYEYASASEIKTTCAFHKDTSPSCFVNVDKKVFKCQTAGCEQAGDIITFLAAKTKLSRNFIILELAKLYGLENDEQVIDVFTVERFHQALINKLTQPLTLLAELYKRGITDEDIKQYRLGFDSSTGRITIPIKNRDGFFVNLRKYLPGAPGAEKFKNAKGHGQARLFPIEQMDYDKIMLCGGELKAIAAARQLNPHGIGAVCSTTGEGNWDKNLTDYFIDKTIFTTFDIDEAGQSAAHNRCKMLNNKTKWIGITELPLDKTDYPKGDINDYVANGGQLFPLLYDEKYTRQWLAGLTTKSLSDDVPITYDLADCIKADITGTRIQTTAVITSIDTAPYIIPKNISATCDRSQTACNLCNIFKGKEDDIYEINAESPNLLDMVNSRKTSHREPIMEALGIPKGCKIVDFNIHGYFNCEDARISPQLEITNRAADRLLQSALIISGERTDEKTYKASPELNETYQFIGRNWPHPQNQQAILLLSKYKQTSDALSSFKLENEYLEYLKVFSPSEWTANSIKLKLDEIYTDLSANVTRIFERNTLHLAVDLAYHSPLFMNFDEKIVKGWSEILILGDSAQGKSETAIGLMKHYKLGEKVECKNVSVAGLLGGLQKHGDRWMCSWGMIPMHDKRLILLEELKGASTEIISKLTDMRSSGIAEIPKIEKRRTNARTRLLANSNTRSGRNISEYNYGIEAISELIGNPEDVRRFDFALLVSSNEIKPDILNQLQSSRPVVEHIYTGDLCRNLILWAWTANCQFSSEALNVCLEAATELSGLFSDQVPLVDKGSIRYKIARLAAALAARTFSIDVENNTNDILVRTCHVEFIRDLLKSTYSSDIFGYLDFTKSIKAQDKLVEPETIKTEILTLAAGFAKELCGKILHKNRIEIIDIQDWSGWDREQSQKFLSILVRKNALERSGGRNYYQKSAEFIGFLKHLLSNGQLIDRPKHLEKEKEKF